MKSVSGRTCRRRWVSDARCGSIRRPTTIAGRNFPVLYLFHGAGDIESGWTMIGRANNILDNLIAEGKARPMVVVMPLGHAVQSFWAGPAKPSPNAPAPAARGAGQPPAPAGLNLFGRELVEEVIPMVEADLQGLEAAGGPGDRRPLHGRRADDERRIQPARAVPSRRHHELRRRNARADVSVVLRESREDQPAVQDVLDCGRQRRRARRRRRRRR